MQLTALLPKRRSKPKPPERVELILRHTTKDDFTEPGILTRIKLPISEARANLGARGFYVNYIVNWPFLLASVFGTLFVVWELILLIIGGITNPVSMALHLLFSAAIGGGLGYVVGRLYRKHIHSFSPEQSYHVWAEYDPVKKQNTFVPMDYEAASTISMDDDQKQEYLKAVGLLAPPQKASQNGQSQVPDPRALFGGTIPVFTAKGFYGALQVMTAKEVMARPKGNEGIIKAVSMATIALAFFGILVLAGLTFLSPDASTDPPPSPNQGISDARVQP